MIKTEIISYNGSLYNGDSNLVVLPTKTGEIGIMKNHEAIITQLQEVNILIYHDKKIDKSIPVKSGFAEVVNNKLIVTISQ